MTSPVNAPSLRCVLWGEAHPAQLPPQLQRVPEVSVACLVAPSTNPVVQLQRGAGQAAVADPCPRACSDGHRKRRSGARPPWCCLRPGVSWPLAVKDSLRHMMKYLIWADSFLRVRVPRTRPDSRTGSE